MINTFCDTFVRVLLAGSAPQMRRLMPIMFMWEYIYNRNNARIHIMRIIRGYMSSIHFVIPVYMCCWREARRKCAGWCCVPPALRLPCLLLALSTIFFGKNIHLCDRTLAFIHAIYSQVWHDSFICVKWLIPRLMLRAPSPATPISSTLFEENKQSFAWHDSFMCVTRLIHVCDMTHSYVWYDSFICVIWLIHMCDMTCSYGRHDSFTGWCCVPWAHRLPCLVHILPNLQYHTTTHRNTHKITMCVAWLIHMLPCLVHILQILDEP